MLQKLRRGGRRRLGLAFGMASERIGLGARADMFAGGAAAAPVRGERLLALDQAARDIVRNRRDDALGAVAFRDQHAAVARVLEEAERAAIVCEVDEADHVEEQPRPVAVADAEIEQFHIVGRLVEDRPDRVLKKFEPRGLGLAQIGERLVLLGALGAGAAHGAAQVRRPALFRLQLVHFDARMHYSPTVHIQF